MTGQTIAAAAAVALVCIVQAPESQAFTPLSTKSAFSPSRQVVLQLARDNSDQTIISNDDKKGEEKSKWDFVTPPTWLGKDDSWASALKMKKEMSLQADWDAVFQTHESVAEASLADVVKDNDVEAFQTSMPEAPLETEQTVEDEVVSSMDDEKEESFLSVEMELDTPISHHVDNVDTASDETIETVAAAPPLVEAEVPQEEELLVAEGRLAAHFDNGDDDDNDDDDMDEADEETPDVKDAALLVQTVIVAPVTTETTNMGVTESKLTDALNGEVESKAKVSLRPKMLDLSDNDVETDEVESAEKTVVEPVVPEGKVEDAVAAAVAAVENVASSSVGVDSPPEEEAKVSNTVASVEETIIKVPSPPKEMPSVSTQKSSIATDDTEQDLPFLVPFWSAITDSTTRIMDTFKPEQSVVELKQQDGNVILEAATNHLSKAAASVGKAMLLTLGASFKAVTSPDVAESIREASSCVSQAVESIPEVTKGFRSFGAVGETFFRSFSRTRQSSDAFDAVMESAKECTSLIACVVAFGAKKQGGSIVERQNEIVTEEPMQMTKEEDIVTLKVKEMAAKEAEANLISIPAMETNSEEPVASEAVSSEETIMRVSVEKTERNIDKKDMTQSDMPVVNLKLAEAVSETAEKEITSENEDVCDGDDYTFFFAKWD